MKNISKSTGYLIVAAFWLTICLLWSTNTQAQNTLCDYVYTSGSQYQFEVAVPATGNALPTMLPLYVVTYGGSSMPWNIGNQPMLAEDSCFQNSMTHMVFNYNPSNGSYYDTLMTCIFYELIDSTGNIDTLMCCDDWVWDGSSVWFKLMQQQPPNCDSLSYSLSSGLPLTVYGNASGPMLNPLNINWNFTACNALTCYIPQGSGSLYSFPLINVTDTVKLCYDAVIDWNGTTTTCNYCDSLVFDYNDSIWVLYSYQGNTTGISELEITRLNDNKIYDLLGRELNEVPLGQMYIRNQKLYISK